MSSSHFAVLGGGISGLISALRLAERGHRVTLIEGSDQLGGLGTFFQHEGRTFERFYHCMLPSDGPLLQVLESLGLTSEIYWKPSSFAYAHQRAIYPLNTPKDLLAFRPLPFLDRLRVGFTGAWGRVCSAKGLDDISTAEWLRGLSGRRAFGTFWQPMLEAKFGDSYDDVPALWFWTRFNREKGESKGEVKGYIRGGYKRITDAFRQRLTELGVTLRMQESIQQVDLDEEGRPFIQTAQVRLQADHLVLTLPWPVIRHCVGDKLRQQATVPHWNIDFQGVINHVLFLRRPLTPHYWLATPETRYPFDGVIETSTLTDEEDRGTGRHVVYLTKYLHRTDPRYLASDADLKKEWLAALQHLFPDLSPNDVEADYVFRAPFVEPIYTRGYLKKRPPEVLVPGRVSLATTVQVYPVVTSWNGSAIQVQRTLDLALP
ncbi:Protoporphyrinogen oxidase [Prosthecobacter debontii]|uniref:Protoporphyrinogen oxidase n=1 Tax=Prosthecobacter debontii TaxID=48467 RepID=A0A1T4XM71_9BACT|nr:FAD-dependent oxidoreductase [Prosthecobacter debontii]SKA90483.1 Protoporphyrinogen oxidase [Prosthecobacter debontii]